MQAHRLNAYTQTRSWAYVYVLLATDDEFAKTVTVVLDDEEVMTLDFVDIGTYRLPSSSHAEHQYERQEQQQMQQSTSSSPVAQVSQFRFINIDINI